MASSPTFQDDGERECGCCFTSLRYMQEPVYLTCGDIYCKKCAEERFADLAKSDPDNFITCQVCRHRVRYVIYQVPGKIKEVYCTNCDAEAIKYCKKCVKRLCEIHLESHDQFYMASELINHQLIPIENYLEHSVKFEVRRCTIHNKKLTQACRDCHKPVCSNCQSDTRCEANRSFFKNNRQHACVKIPELVEQMKQDYEQDVRLVSNEVTRISKLEHEAATKLTENEDKNSQLMMEVDEAVERQIATIKESAQTVKTTLEKTSRQNGEKVAQYLYNLAGRKEELTTLLLETTGHINASHEVDIIDEFSTRTSELRSKLDDVKIDDIPVLSTAQIGTTGSDPKSEDYSIQAMISTHPKSLAFIKKHQMVVCPNSIRWTYGGRLACVTDSKIILLKVRSIGKKLQFNALAKGSKLVGTELNTLCFFLESEKITSNGETSENCLVTWLIPYIHEDEAMHKQKAMQIADKFDDISKKYNFVVALNRKKKEVHIQKWREPQSVKIDVSQLENPYCCLAKGDDAFLITNCQAEGSLMQYEQFGKEYKQVWVCDGLQEPSIICEDQHLNIFVASGSADAVIYTISPSGQKQREFRSPHLGTITADMAIYGDKLAVAQYDGIKLFTIKY